MTTCVRNRLLALGILWGLLLAAVPALVMTNPYQLTGFLVAAITCAMLSGAVGTLSAGWRAARSTARSKSAGCSGLLAALRTGTFQGLMGGAIAALLFWGLMALSISSFK